MRSTSPRDLLLRWFTAALAAVDGRQCVRTALADRSFFAPVSLIAIGKAAIAMAQGAQDVVGDQIESGLVITKHGYEVPMPWPVLTAGHPLPDQASLNAGETLIAFINQLPLERHVLFLLSGGASSLAEVLAPRLDLTHLRQLNEWILSSGTDIVTANELRKSLSMIKAGRLAQVLVPRHVLCLTISDVPGNESCSIGSGPLVKSKQFDLPESLPAWVLKLIARAPDSAFPAAFDNVQTEIIASIEMAMQAAGIAVEQDGYRVELHPGLLNGDVFQCGQQLARSLKTSPAGCAQVWGGETTIELPPQPGRGGRNQSLALAAAIALDGGTGQTLLAAGTDGSDGPGHDAGGLVDNKTVQRGEAMGFDAQHAFEIADAGTFLEASGDLITTGPTGTNVMDLAIGITV